MLPICRHSQPKGRRWRVLAYCMLLALAFAPPAAAQTDTGIPLAIEGAASTENAADALRRDLNQLDDEIAGIFERTDAEVGQIRPSRKAARSVANWKTTLGEAYADALDNDNPKAALFDAWVLGEQVVRRFSTDDIEEAFGKAHPLMLDAARDVLRSIEWLAADYFEDDDLEELRDRVEQHVREHPLQIDPGSPGLLSLVKGTLFAARDAGESALGVGGSAVKSVIDVPLMPKRAINRIDRSTEDFHRFTLAVEGIQKQMETLPEEIRKEIGLLARDLAGNEEPITRLLNELRGTLEALDQSLVLADRLTTHSRLTLQASEEPLKLARETSEAIERAATEGRALAGEARALTESLSAPKDGHAPAADAATTATSRQGGERGFRPQHYEEAAHAIEAGAVEVRNLLAEIRGLIEDARHDGDDKQPKDKDGGFDVREYDRAAQSIERAAGNLRGVLVEMRGLLGEDLTTTTVAPARGLIGHSVRQVSTEAASLVHRITLCVAGLLVLAFLLALALLRIRARRS